MPIVVENETIPYETITKDVSNGSDTTNRVIQAGKNGIREFSHTSYRGSIRFDEHGLPKWNLETNGTENLF